MGLFDWMGTDPSKKAKKYLDKIPGEIKPYYDPFIEAGKNQIPGLQDQYSNLLNDPGAMLNKFGESYQKSPGFDFALQQALQGAGNAAAAGGMAGSPQHEQQNMELATNLFNQDYNDYLQKALGLYDKGLSGSEGLYSGGMNASDALAKMLAENLGNQASNAFGGAQWKNNMNMAGLGMLSPGLSMMTNNFGQGNGGASGNSGSGGGNSANQDQMMKMLAMMFM
jgi:hypothetical protein